MKTGAETHGMLGNVVGDRRDVGGELEPGWRCSWCRFSKVFTVKILNSGSGSFTLEFFRIGGSSSSSSHSGFRIFNVVLETEALKISPFF